ncbi:MAG: phosphoribosylglycinamide formyltransferase [Bilifractor sp.]|jgi:phosphoribosylglycinamide formyltransferase-1
MMKMVVIVSGGGTNLQAIMDSIKSGEISNAEIMAVVSNNPGAYALKRAEKQGIPTRVVTRADYPDPEAFNDALLSTVNEFSPDLIVLAGCLVIIPEKMVKAYENRIINIHPSLIPSFCGTGCYGLHVHEKVLERGVRVTGATVHFVDTGTDSGPIILQKAVRVRQDDTPEILQRRVMEEAEWQIMPEAINLIANGRVKVKNGRVEITDYDRLDR